MRVLALAPDGWRYVVCVYSYDGLFSAAFFAALGGMEMLCPKCRRSTNSKLEGVLRQGGPNTCDLLDNVGISLLLFLGSQWWQSAWHDAISRNLEVRRPDFRLHSCREYRSKCVRKRQVETVHSCLGSSLIVCCIHNFYAGEGLNRFLAWPQPRSSAWLVALAYKSPVRFPAGFHTSMITAFTRLYNSAQPSTAFDFNRWV